MPPLWRVHPPAKVAGKKKQKQKKKGICNLSAKKNIEYMTFATMNYVSLPFY